MTVFVRTVNLNRLSLTEIKVYSPRMGELGFFGVRTNKNVLMEKKL